MLTNVDDFNVDASSLRVEGNDSDTNGLVARDNVARLAWRRVAHRSRWQVALRAGGAHVAPV